MAARSSVTWMHCSVCYEVTKRKNTRVRTDASMCPRGREHVRADVPMCPCGCDGVRAERLASVRTCWRPHGRELVRADIGASVSPPCLSPSLLPPSLALGGRAAVARPRPPSSPSSLSPAGFAGEAARRRSFFRPSSPSDPSKLYSSLGWLNSKVPKPFFPFTPRLIDVNGSRVGTLWSLGNLIDLELNLCSIESNEGVTTKIIIIAS
jgi:hypothetical protein